LIKKVTVTISKTANGLNDYIQVISEDQFSVNFTAVATKIVLDDKR